MCLLMCLANSKHKEIVRKVETLRLGYQGEAPAELNGQADSSESGAASPQISNNRKHKLGRKALASSHVSRQTARIDLMKG